MTIIFNYNLLSQVNSLIIKSTTISKHVDDKLIEKNLIIDSCYDQSLTLRETHVYYLFKKMSGLVIDSTQTGVWEYYDETSKLEYKVDYSNGAKKSIFSSYYAENPDSFNLITNPSFESHSEIICGYATYDSLRDSKSTEAALKFAYSINSDYGINEDDKTNNVHGWSSYVNEYAKLIDIRECTNSPSFVFIIDSIRPKTGYSYADLVLGCQIDLALSNNKALYGSAILQNRLLYPLIKGEKYYLEFWIHHDYTSKFYSNGLKIFFSEKPFSRMDLQSLRIKLADIKIDKIIKHEGWERMSFVFKANNYARYMCITSMEPADIMYATNNEWNDSIFSYYGFNHLKANYIFDDFKLVKEKNKRLEVINIIPKMPIIKTSTLNSDPTLMRNKTEKAYVINKIYSIANIFFDHNCYNIDQAEISELDSLAQYLCQNDILKLEIYGHTDDTGSKKYNMQLSRNRAKSVFNYLVQKGVSANRISYFGFGSTNPKAPNTTEANKIINRRVEIKILGY